MQTLSPVAFFQGGNHDATDRGAESEGRRGQDDDDGQPRRRPGGRGAQDARPRPRPPGPRHAAPRPAAGPVRAVALRGPDPEHAAGRGPPRGRAEPVHLRQPHRPGRRRGRADRHRRPRGHPPRPARRRHRAVRLRPDGLPAVARAS